MHDNIWSDFRNLPVEAQRQVADFIAFLRQRYPHPGTKKRPLTDWDEEPFIGMWRGRAEMEDSTEWVRRTRQEEWSERRG